LVTFDSIRAVGLEFDVGQPFQADGRGKRVSTAVRLESLTYGWVAEWFKAPVLKSNQTICLQSLKSLIHPENYELSSTHRQPRALCDNVPKW
jgi:hypothetical protein